MLAASRRVLPPPHAGCLLSGRAGAVCDNCRTWITTAARPATITVFLADDNLIVREGVRALIERAPRPAGRRRGRRLRRGRQRRRRDPAPGARHRHPDAADVQREGIDAAKEVRKRHPGTGVVVLSQYDDPEYAVSLLAEGSAGYGYLLKDHVAEGNQLVDAIRAVATGGTALDPAIVDALVRPVVTGRRAHRPPRRSCWPWWPRASRSRPSPRPASSRPRRSPPRSKRSSSSWPRRVGRDRGRAAAAAAAAPGHRRPRRAGRDAVPAAARRPGRQAPPGRAAHRRDRAGRGHRADERHPGLLDHRRARRSEPAGRPAQCAPGRHEQRHPGRGRHGDAVRGRRRHGRLRRPVRPGGPRRPGRGRGAGHARRASCRDQHPMGGRRACRHSASGSACRPARRRPPCSGPRSDWSTRWWATPSIWPSGCSSWPRPARPCCPRPPARRSHDRCRPTALPSQLVKGRDTPVLAFKIMGRVAMSENPAGAWPCAASARPSRPRTRRCGRCGAST